MPDEIDRLLDEALSTYAVAPDRPGLEKRVLMRVNGRRSRPRPWFAYASAAAVVIAGLLTVSPLRVTEKQRPMPNIGEAIDKHTPSQTTQQPVLLPAAVPAKRPIRRRHPEPKRPEFPTSSPLTSQERALLEIARSQPAQLAALSRPMEPLEVPLIHIEPLDKEEK